MVGTAYAQVYNNSNISLYNNILSSAIYNIIGLQNSRLTNLSSDVSIYQSQVTDGTLYNFPETNIIENISISGLHTNTYTYIEKLNDNNIPVKWSSLLINGGDRLYFDTNVQHMVKNIKENYVFNTISDELIDYLPKNLYGLSAIFGITSDVTDNYNFTNFINGTIIITRNDNYYKTIKF